MSGRKTKAFDDNPEWTRADFARARKPEAALSPDVLAQFRNHRGPQKAPTKQMVSIRLSPDVLEHFRSTGPGWQTRIDETLRKAARLKG
jgi:uncharacterized protein (DUF4415 family)